MHRLLSDMSASVLEAHATMLNGIRGGASKEQVQAAKALIDSFVAVDKVARLDAGTPTEIAETQERPASEVLSERERLDAEIDAALSDPALRAEFERRLAKGRE